RADLTCGGGWVATDVAMIDFGEVNVVGDAGWRAVLLANTGAADIAVSMVSLAGNDPQQYACDFPGQLTLAPCQSTEIAVNFQPMSPGVMSALLVITGVGFTSLQVALTGTGILWVATLATVSAAFCP